MMDGGLLPNPAAGMLSDMLEIFVRLVTGVTESVFSFCFVVSGCSAKKRETKSVNIMVITVPNVSAY